MCFLIFLAIYWVVRRLISRGTVSLPPFKKTSASTKLMQRISIPAENFETSTEVQIQSNIFKLILDAMMNSTAELVKSAHQVDRIAVEGPMWKRVSNSVENYDSVSPERVFAVKGTNFLAMPHSCWDAFDATLVFYDKSNNILAKASIDDEINVRCSSTKQTYRLSTPDESLVNTVKRAVNEVNLESTDCLASLPTPTVDAWSPKPGSQWCTLPEWLASTFILWASHHLRIHVLTSSCVNLEEQLGDSPDFFFETATIEHAKRYEQIIRRCTFRLHDSMPGCICKNHRNAAQTAAQHWRSVIQVEFCGRKCDGVCCPLHGKKTTLFEDNHTCMDGLAIKVLCFHREEKVTCFEVLNLKLQDDKFFNVFAAACVEITEVPKNVSIPTLQCAVRNAFKKSMKEDAEERREIDIQMRDQQVESIIRSKDYFFGLPHGKKSGKSSLRKRVRDANSTHGVPPNWICACGPTHGHLFPTH